MSETTPATAETTEAPPAVIVFGGLNYEDKDFTARGKVTKGQEPRKFKARQLESNSINREDPGQALAEMLDACSEDQNRLALCFIKGWNAYERSNQEGLDEFSKTAKQVMATREKDPSKFKWADGLTWEELVTEVTARFS